MKKEIENDKGRIKENKILILDSVEEDFKEFNLSFKVIVLGNSGVGKTCITNMAIKSKFLESSNTTIGIDYLTLFIQLNDKIIKLQIWDTCGQEMYRSLISGFYKNSSLAVIVYAIDDRNSFKDIENWVKDLKTMASPDIKIIMIGNKKDLEEERLVSYEEGKKLADEYKFAEFFETSAKTGDNIKELFLRIASILYADYLSYLENSFTSNSTKSTSFLSASGRKKQKSSCC
jgi:Ras-related protein Rab-1A